MDYSDILPFQDQLVNLSGKAIDIVIETPGGFAEAAEDMIKLIRSRYDHVGMIVPGWAKSAGTIFAMAGDEILMGATSGLGPIDAQIRHNNKSFSAHAFLEGLDQIKKEVIETKRLNPAYIPILQNISPGEIQHCHNAQNFSETLVTQWLEQYKFKYWTKRRTSGEPVTQEYKRKRAVDIAKKLSDQSRWLTHGRSIRIADLEKELNLEITDYSKSPALNDAITRYYTLLRMTFETNVFKIFETPVTQIYRFTGVEGVPSPQPSQQDVDLVEFKIPCSKCKVELSIQANFKQNVPVKPGNIHYPVADNVLRCPQCGTEHNLSTIRLQLEAQSGRRLVAQ